MRIKILCEGSTEEGLRKLLAQAIDIQGCGIKIKSYEGVGALLRGLDGRTEFELRSGVQIIFCLVDYYHYPLPQDTKSLPLEQRLNAIKLDVVGRIDESRRSSVRCHVVVHEVEAWILADEQMVAQRLKIKNLSPWQQPEAVNDMKPPAKILEELFRTRSPLKKRYSKYKDGVDLLGKIDWQKVYTKCPTFKQLVDDLRTHCQK
jgi:Domain of unknown function (DUF4276)